jgi:hypothetical protein
MDESTFSAVKSSAAGVVFAGIAALISHVLGLHGNFVYFVAIGVGLCAFIATSLFAKRVNDQHPQGVSKEHHAWIRSVAAVEIQAVSNLRPLGIENPKEWSDFLAHYPRLRSVVKKWDERAKHYHQLQWNLKEKIGPELIEAGITPPYFRLQALAPILFEHATLRIQHREQGTPYSPEWWSVTRNPERPIVEEQLYVGVSGRTVIFIPPEDAARELENVAHYRKRVEDFLMVFEKWPEFIECADSYLELIYGEIRREVSEALNEILTRDRVLWARDCSRCRLT